MNLLNGQTYTVFVNTGKIIDFTTDAGMKEKLGAQLSASAQVVSVERPFFTRVRAVTVKPLHSYNETQFRGIVTSAFDKLGYDNIRIERIEGGQTSTSITKEIVKRGVDAISPATNTVKSLATRAALLLLATLIVFFAVKATVKAR